MGKVRVLPEILANKIAAGEIVERPASVVKELVENSLDAAASSISVQLRGGGKRLIQILDDGQGMSEDDAVLAFEHHATSKIRSAEDLSAIASLGFRGEALPSIASVARVTLRTRSSADASGAGTKVEIQGGVLRTVKTESWHQGTEVAVRDLFFNVPARKKFLRTRETELGHSTRLVTQYALAHPEMRFTLESDQRKLVDVSRVDSLSDRIFQLFGERFQENLVEVAAAAGSVEITGFCSPPHEQRTNSYSQYCFVNRRMVRDKILSSAIRQAYRHTMPSSAYPVVLLFLTLPYDSVDVNAHPAKTEIRFRNQSAVYGLVRESIERALLRSRSIPDYVHTQAEHFAPAQGFAPMSSGNTVSPSPPPPATFDFSGSSPSMDRLEQFPTLELSARVAESVPGEDHHRMRLRPELLLSSSADSQQTPFHSRGIRLLGQVRESYILGCDGDGLVIIDQHVAHERVLYEKLALKFHKREVEVQGLLVPRTFELSATQRAVLDHALEELRQSGFDVEPFGGSSVVVRSVPLVVRDEDCRQLLLEVLDGVDRTDRTVDLSRLSDRLAVNMACRAAIKVNTRLTEEKMQWLMDELARTRIPTNCPHGRPVLLRFGWHEIERNFGRI